MSAAPDKEMEESDQEKGQEPPQSNNKPKKPVFDYKNHGKSKATKKVQSSTRLVGMMKYLAVSSYVGWHFIVYGFVLIFFFSCNSRYKQVLRETHGIARQGHPERWLLFKKYCILVSNLLYSITVEILQIYFIIGNGVQPQYDINPSLYLYWIPERKTYGRCNRNWETCCKEISK